MSLDDSVLFLLEAGAILPVNAEQVLAGCGGLRMRTSRTGTSALTAFV